MNRIFSLEELEDFPINISSVLYPHKRLEYSLDRSVIGLTQSIDEGNRESAFKLIRSNKGHIIEATNRFVSVTFRNELVLTKNLTHATSFKIISKGIGFVFKVGSKCLFADSSRLGLELCEDYTRPWRNSRQVFMICLLQNSMLKMYYELCEDGEECENNVKKTDVDLNEMFENSIIDKAFSETLKPFIRINKYMEEKHKKRKRKTSCEENC